MTPTSVLPSFILEVLVGQLLSDGHGYRSSPTGNTRIEWSFGLRYMAYASWLYGLLVDYCGTPVGTLASGQLRLKTLSLSIFNHLHALFYVLTPSGKWIKVVPATIGTLMTPVVLAHLIMGDGSYDKHNNAVFIFPNGFTHEDCIRLVAAITGIGIPTTVRADRVGKDGNKQYKLAIANKQLPVLRSKVKNYMHESMLYRIGL